MTVRELMHKSPACCEPASDLLSVARTLNSMGCGALPVTYSDGRLAGIVTDRDICMAVACENRRPSELTAGDIMTREVAACNADDEIHAALDIMRSRKVRRLPVIGGDGRVEGLLCASDLVLCARHDDGRRPDLSYEDIMGTLKALNRHAAFRCPKS
jgi:CBS domain-containing protein